MISNRGKVERACQRISQPMESLFRSLHSTTNGMPLFLKTPVLHLCDANKCDWMLKVMRPSVKERIVQVHQHVHLTSQSICGQVW